MKLEELERNLIVKNDTCILTDEEFKRKYFDDENGYKTFLESYYNEFTPVKLFPLMIIDRYPFLFENINKKLSSENLSDDDKIITGNLLQRITNEKSNIIQITDEDIIQMLDVAMNDVGADKLRHKIKNYRSYIKCLYENVKVYNKLRTEELPSDEELSEVIEIGSELIKNCKDINVAQVYFSEIKKMYPSLNLCFSPEMLIALNYAMKRVDDEEQLKQLMNDSRHIISLTTNNKEFSSLYNERFDFKEFLKISKVTNKKIKKYEKFEKEKYKVLKK